MYDWIEIDGVMSTALDGLVVMNWSPTLFTRLKRDTTWIPGRIGQIQSQYPTYDEPTIPIELAIIGDDEAQVRSRWMTIKRWLGKGRRLRLSDTPDYYTLGEITQVTVKADEIAPEAGQVCWMLVTATWAMCPGCLMRCRSAQSGWLPALDTPIPQQLTAQTATESKAFTTAGYMTKVTYDGLYPARLYFLVTGTWKTLKIGGVAGLTVNEAATTSTTLYIDCDAQTIYTLDGGLQVNMSGVISGDYPAPEDDFTLAIGGDGISVTVRMLVIAQT